MSFKLVDGVGCHLGLCFHLHVPSLLTFGVGCYIAAGGKSCTLFLFAAFVIRPPGPDVLQHSSPIARQTDFAEVRASFQLRDRGLSKLVLAIILEGSLGLKLVCSTRYAESRETYGNLRGGNGTLDFLAASIHIMAYLFWAPFLACIYTLGDGCVEDTASGALFLVGGLFEQLHGASRTFRIQPCHQHR